MRRHAEKSTGFCGLWLEGKTLNTAPARIASISTSNTDARATAFFRSQKKTPNRS